MTEILLLLFGVSVTANVLILRAWIKELEESIDLLDMSLRLINEYEALLEEGKYK